MEIFLTFEHQFRQNKQYKGNETNKLIIYIENQPGNPDKNSHLQRYDRWQNNKLNFCKISIGKGLLFLP